MKVFTVLVTVAASLISLIPTVYATAFADPDIAQIYDDLVARGLPVDILVALNKIRARDLTTITVTETDCGPAGPPVFPPVTTTITSTEVATVPITITTAIPSTEVPQTTGAPPAIETSTVPATTPPAETSTEAPPAPSTAVTSSVAPPAPSTSGIENPPTSTIASESTGTITVPSTASITATSTRSTTGSTAGSSTSSIPPAPNAAGIAKANLGVWGLAVLAAFY